MNKNLEELKKVKSFYCFEIKKYMIPLLEDFGKRLTELEKDKTNILEHHEINETGGVDNIKIVLDDPKLKTKGE